MATKGDVEGAVAKFKKAKEWDSGLILEPETEAKQLAAFALVEKGGQLARDGDIEKALAESAPSATASYDKAIEINPEGSDAWNGLCWYGSLHGYAADVMDACEKAVARAPENGNYQDSRGLARALTGDTAGAISDFQAFIDWSDNDEWKAKRQKWIDDLRAGKNPFTEEALKSLLEE